MTPSNHPMIDCPRAQLICSRILSYVQCHFVQSQRVHVQRLTLRPSSPTDQRPQSLVATTAIPTVQIRQIQQTRKSTQTPCHINQHANTSPEVTQALSTHKCVNTRKPQPTAAATHAPSPSSQTAATTHRRPASNAQIQDRHHHRSSPTPSAGPACKRRLTHSSSAISYL